MAPSPRNPNPSPSRPLSAPLPLCPLPDPDRIGGVRRRRRPRPRRRSRHRCSPPRPPRPRPPAPDRFFLDASTSSTGSGLRLWRPRRRRRPSPLSPPRLLLAGRQQAPPSPQVQAPPHLVYVVGVNQVKLERSGAVALDPSPPTTSPASPLDLHPLVAPDASEHANSSRVSSRGYSPSPPPRFTAVGRHTRRPVSGQWARSPQP